MKTDFYITTLKLLRSKGPYIKHDVTKEINDYFSDDREQVNKFLHYMKESDLIEYTCNRFDDNKPIFDIHVAIKKGGIEHLETLSGSNRSKWAIGISVFSLIVSIVAIVASLIG